MLTYTGHRDNCCKEFNYLQDGTISKTIYKILCSMQATAGGHMCLHECKRLCISGYNYLWKLSLLQLQLELSYINHTNLDRHLNYFKKFFPLRHFHEKTNYLCC